MFNDLFFNEYQPSAPLNPLSPHLSDTRAKYQPRFKFFYSYMKKAELFQMCIYTPREWTKMKDLDPPS